MSRLSRHRRPRRKALFVEALEPRIVLDGQLADGVSGTPGEPDPAPLIGQFESADELRGFLIESAVERWRFQFGQPVSPWGYYPPYIPTAIGNTAEPVSFLAADSPAGFDGTNVQVDRNVLLQGMAGHAGHEWRVEVST